MDNILKNLKKYKNQRKSKTMPDNKEKIKNYRNEIRDFKNQINLLKRKIKALQKECEMELIKFLGE